MERGVEVRGMTLRGRDILLWFQDPTYPYGMASICHTYGEPLHIPGHWAGWELARIDFGESTEIHRTLDTVKREVASRPAGPPTLTRRRAGGADLNRTR